MGNLEDLQTLIRLLKKYELPVSPILEYAIREKEEALCIDDSVNDSEGSAEPSLKIYKVRDCGSILHDFSTYLYTVRSERTAQVLLKQIDIPIRKYICKLVDPDANSIYSYQTVEDVESCICILKQNDEFVKEDHLCQNRLSEALMYYVNFLSNCK